MTEDSKKSKPRARVLVADDESSARSGLATLLRDEGFDVWLAEDGYKAITRIQEEAPDVLITDLRMPGLDGIELLRRAREVDSKIIVVLVTAYADVETAVRAMQEGAEHYLTKPLQIDELVVVINRALERRDLRDETTQLRARLKDHLSLDNIVGSSPAMQAVFNVIEQVAPTKVSVLITGESGTGKELVAQAIHENSPRSGGPFVKLHCAALAETILESELFGHEKGAFTGSIARREGRFKQADGGTLFLDEIGDISASIQVKLLRFLQERTFERVGGNETLKVDVRIIAATNRESHGRGRGGPLPRRPLLSPQCRADRDAPASRPPERPPASCHPLPATSVEGQRKAHRGIRRRRNRAHRSVQMAGQRAGARERHRACRRAL